MFEISGIYVLFAGNFFDGIVTALCPGEGCPGDPPAHAILMTMCLLPCLAMPHAVDSVVLDPLIQA